MDSHGAERWKLSLVFRWIAGGRHCRESDMGGAINSTNPWKPMKNPWNPHFSSGFEYLKWNGYVYEIYLLVEILGEWHVSVYIYVSHFFLVEIGFNKFPITNWFHTGQVFRETLIEQAEQGVDYWCGSLERRRKFLPLYHLVMTNIANWKIHDKWRFYMVSSWENHL